MSQFKIIDVQIRVETDDPDYAEHVWRWVIAKRLGEDQPPLELCDDCRARPVH